MLRGPLLSPALAALVLLPAVWLLPQTLPAGLQIQLSGACLVLLMLGWPLTVLVLAAVAALVWLLGQADAVAALSQWLWVGLAPATLALGIGAALRRWLPANLFVYTLGRAFMGTAVAVFLSGRRPIFTIFAIQMVTGSLMSIRSSFPDLGAVMFRGLSTACTGAPIIAFTDRQAHPAVPSKH